MAILLPHGLPYLRINGVESVSYFIDVVNGHIYNSRRRLGTVSSAGYEMIGVSLGGTPVYPKLSHRLIYEHTNGAIPANLVIDHKDDNKLNNRSENLHLTTRSYNSHKAYTNGQRKPPCLRGNVMATNLNDNVITEYSSMGRAARELGIHSFSVSQVINGITKTAFSKIKQVSYSFKLKS